MLTTVKKRVPAEKGRKVGIQVVERLGRKFEKAQGTTHVPPDTVGDIEDIVKRLEREERFWQETKAIDSKTAFAMFHAIRNARLVAQKLKQRVEDAPKVGDNPGVADDALKVIPILDIISTKGEIYKSRSTALYERKAVYKLVRQLRKEAKGHGLLPSEEEERKELKADELQHQATALVKKIDLGNFCQLSPPISHRRKGKRLTTVWPKSL